MLTPMFNHYYPFVVSEKWSVEMPVKVKHQTFLTRNGPEVEGNVVATSPRHLCKMELISTP